MILPASPLACPGANAFQYSGTTSRSTNGEIMGAGNAHLRRISCAGKIIVCPSLKDRRHSARCRPPSVPTSRRCGSIPPRWCFGAWRWLSTFARRRDRAGRVDNASAVWRAGIVVASLSRPRLLPSSQQLINASLHSPILPTVSNVPVAAKRTAIRLHALVLEAANVDHRAASCFVGDLTARAHRLVARP
jgi:hypothetical protein